MLRLVAPNANVRLVGDLLARGDTGAGASGGGAGGSIRIEALRLAGRDAIDASGGAGINASTNGGGAGGRVALRYRELGPGVDLEAQVDVSGGHNRAPTRPTPSVWRAPAPPGSRSWTRRLASPPESAA